MNKKIVLIIFGIMSILKLEAKKVEGTIIYNNDSSAHVYFEVFNLEKIQEKIKYYNSKGEIIKLKPYQFKKIRFKFDNEYIKMISCNI